MNWQQFRKNVGMRFLLRPPARSVDQHGVDHSIPDDDYWMLQDFTSLESFRIYRILSGHVAELGKDHVYDFRSDPAKSSAGIRIGHLILKMQIVVTGPNVRLIPNARPGEGVPASNVQRRRQISTELGGKLLDFLKSQPVGTVGIASTQGDGEAHGGDNALQGEIDAEARTNKRS